MSGYDQAMVLPQLFVKMLICVGLGIIITIQTFFKAGNGRWEQEN